MSSGRSVGKFNNVVSFGVGVSSGSTYLGKLRTEDGSCPGVSRTKRVRRSREEAPQGYMMSQIDPSFILDRGLSLASKNRKPRAGRRIGFEALPRRKVV